MTLSPPIYGDVRVPCRRTACDELRTDADAPYCSPLCRRIDDVTSGGNAARSHPVTHGAVVRLGFAWLDTRCRPNP